MSGEEVGKPGVKVGYFNEEELRRRKQLAREKDDADLREGRVTSEELRHRNGLFSGLDLSRATIRLGGVQKLRMKREILAHASRLTGEPDAIEWYRSVPIPSLGGHTAEQIVEAGRGAAVVEYLRQVSSGGFS